MDGSPSVRRAWIEMMQQLRCAAPPPVALRTEGVDRNIPILIGRLRLFLVALRTEGVDRNCMQLTEFIQQQVALRTEGVDRNLWVFNSIDKYVIGRPPYGGRG